MPLPARVHSHRRLVPRHLRLVNSNVGGQVLRQQDRIVPTHLEPSHDLDDLLDQVLREIHAEPVKGLVRQRVARIAQVPLVKVHRHLLRRPLGRIRRRVAADTTDPP